jgi:hypothetical protein
MSKNSATISHLLTHRKWIRIAYENIANTGEYGTITVHVFELELLGFNGVLGDCVKLLLLIESLL